VTLARTVVAQFLDFHMEGCRTPGLGTQASRRLDSTRVSPHKRCRIVFNKISVMLMVMMMMVLMMVMLMFTMIMTLYFLYKN
jgi:hypothetical protein